jgi:hypothetical protein
MEGEAMRAAEVAPLGRRSARQYWRSWLGVVGLIGEFQARLVLTVVYFVLGFPLSLVARAKDPLLLRPRALNSAWLPKAEPNDTLGGARRQF